MNTALAVTENRTSVDDLELEPESAFQEAVRKLCGLFISVIDSKIYLIHQTAREFLLTSTMPIPDATNIWKHSMHLSTSHFELAKTCLLYLHLSGLESEPAVLPGDFARPLRSDQTFQRHAFQSYSAKHWSFHVSRIECESVDSLMSLTLSITTCGSPAFENWIMQLTRKIYSVNMVGLFGRDIAELDQLSLAVNLEIRPLAKMLLKRGLPPTEDDTIINRAATYAIRRCPDMFFLFLDNGLDLETQSNHGNFFLHQAAAYGRIEVAQRLIEAGAAVNMEDEFSREPLHFAVRRRSKALVSLLLEKGARVNHKDKCGQTALFGDIASMPLKDLPVVRKEDIETAAYLLENGAEYEVKDKYGRSPLSWAAGYGRLLIAELLIEHGADINSRDCKGRTPLSWAAGSFFPEHRKLISLLIEHGAQINSRDKNGHTPLSYAAEHLRYQTTAMVAILIQQGAQIETRCNNMRTPLAYAAGRCLIPTLRNLIENGAAANSSDWKGNTPLHAALRNRHFLYDSRRLELYETIKLLLEMGENPNSLSIDGESPMLIVDRMESYGPSQMHDSKRFETGKEEVQNLLRRYGAGEPKLPTSPDSLCQVVAQMTVNLIETVTNSVGIELRDRQIAAKSSVQLFGGWNLHASASSIKLRRNSTIQQEIIDFRLAQTRKSEDDISNPEESQTALRPSGTPPPPDNSPPRKSPEFGLPKAQVSEKANKYAGLAPSEESEDCSYYLHRLADLQQRLFDVNRCLYYLDDHPDDSSKTVNDLIAKVIGQKTREVHESPGFCYELGSDSI